MHNFNISVFNNQILFEVLREMKLFSKCRIKHYNDEALCFQSAEKENNLVIFFENSINVIDKGNFPSIHISKSSRINKSTNELNEYLKMPFTIKELEKKIIFLKAKNEFKKNSLINLNDYIIDKNERKIKKNNLELQLSEKEINFLVLFSEKNEPISKNFVLKNVWNYSEDSETHTVETHIHRLRKKILNKFGDSNFIKNNNKGYFI
tara:strand:- start:1075 stop:1695 length:621 start_codon:yes stop_codon:yes gene_type:complete